MSKNYRSIGYTKKLFGIKGGVRVHIHEDFEAAFMDANVLFLEVDGRKIPYFIQKIKHAPLRVIFEDYADPSKAQLLTNKQIFIPAILTASIETNYTTLEGYLIIDADIGTVGNILEIVEYPQQYLAIVQYQGKERLIPLHEKLIDRIDTTTRTIFVHLPQALLNL